MSAWQLWQGGGEAVRWSPWQLAHWLCLGPRRATAAVSAAWQLVQRAHQPSRRAGAAWCGAWHWVQRCFVAPDFAASPAWQVAHAACERTSCFRWHDPHAVCWCGEPVGHDAAASTLPAWHFSQVRAAALAGV